MNQLPKILVVDDEVGPRLAISWVLKKNGICQCIQCETPESAIAALAENPDINVAIIDLRMPDMLGTELVVKLRDVRPSLKAVLHTGYDDLDAAGASDARALFSAMIEKPANNAQILSVVAQLVRAS